MSAKRSRVHIETAFPQRIAELGQQLNQTLDKAGSSLDQAGDKVERALQPSEHEPKPESK